MSPTPVRKGGGAVPPAAGWTAGDRRRALRFVIAIGVVSFFADMTYEGARAEVGPYLATLGASGFLVGAVSGFGELSGFGLRLLSGRAADVSGRFWAVTLTGYVLQMSAVPMLALTSNWRQAAALVVLERVGKAIRNPPRDAMLARAGERIGGYGWAFGLHEAMDQGGALVGPLLVAAVLGWRHSFPLAFAVLAVPALVTLVCVFVACRIFPAGSRPDRDAARPAEPRRLSRTAWVYLAAACLVAAGFADYSLIAFHLSKSGIADGTRIAVLYAVAMAVGGAGSLLFGRLFDRHGFVVLVVLTVLTSAFAPLLFLGGFALAVVGAAVWGLGQGVHESLLPAALSRWAPPDRRASAFGIFTAAYGTSWFVGSVLIGALYDRSLAATVVFCVVCELLAVPLLLHVWWHDPERPS